MKIVIEIPEKTNAHIRSDYGHGVKGLYDEDREILCDAIYHGTPYKERPHGKWIYHRYDKEFECSNCKEYGWITWNFCPICGSNNRREGDEK